MRRSTVATHV